MNKQKLLEAQARFLSRYPDGFADPGMASIKKKHNVADAAVKGYTDVRRILDRDDVDALVIATPNHWHSLMAIWASRVPTVSSRRWAPARFLARLGKVSTSTVITKRSSLPGKAIWP